MDLWDVVGGGAVGILAAAAFSGKLSKDKAVPGLVKSQAEELLHKLEEKNPGLAKQAKRTSRSKALAVV